MKSNLRLHTIKQNLKEQKRQEMQQQKLNESKDLKKLKDIIKKTLEKEGGAAGLKALKKSVKKSNMPTKGLDKKLNKMSGVKQHQDGDYISTPLTELKKTSF